MGKWVRLHKSGRENFLTGHELRKMAEGLTEDHVTMFCDTFFKLLLEITASMLVFAETGNFTLKLFKSGTSEAIN